MHRKIALVGVLLVLLSLVPAVTGLAHTNAVPHWDLVDVNGPVTGLPETIGSENVPSPASGQNWAYDGTYTWFFYRAYARNPADNDPKGLSHLVLGVCDDDDGSLYSGYVLKKDQSGTWTDYTHATEFGEDSSTDDYYGFKWEPNNAIEKEDNPEDYLFVLRVTGEPGVDFGINEENDWLIKTGGGQDESAEYYGSTNGYVTGPLSPACGFVPEPSGEIEVEKWGNDICVPGDVQWVITGTYTSDVDVDIVITDSNLGWLEPVVIAGSAGTDVAFSVPAPLLLQSIDEGEGPEGAELTNSVSVELYAEGSYGEEGAEPLDSATASWTVTVAEAKLSATASVHRASDNYEYGSAEEIPYGTEVYIKYTVTNEGNVPLDDVNVDGNDGDTDGDFAAASLDPGEPEEFSTASFAATTDLSFIANVTGEYNNSELELNCSASVDPTVTVNVGDPPPTYDVAVTLDGYYDCEASQFIWTALVTNNSSVTADIDVDFDRESFLDTTITLGPGETSNPIIRSESDSGSKTLTVTASIPETEAEDDDDATADDSACEEPPPTCEDGDAALSVDVTSSNGTARVNRGSSVDFSYTITNTGNDTLYDVEVLVNGDLFATISELLPGAENAVTLTEEDVTINGTTTRTAEASGATEIECEATAQDSHTVRLRSTPPPTTYGVEVSLTGTGECDTGYTWVATVTNTSSTSATINVDFDRDGIADTSVTLAAGASTELTRTEAGGDSGPQSLSVTATIDGRTESDTASAAVTLECVVILPPPPLQPPACIPVIKVHVVDESNVGIGGALVKMGDFSTTTAADGWATFTGLPAGTYQINAVASGYVPGKGSVTLAEGACEVTAVVIVKPPTFPPPPPPPPTGNITGSICLLDSLGAVEVTLQNGQTVLVQPGGGYSFEGLPAGTYTVSANSNLGADSQTVSIGGQSPLDAVVDFCFQEAPAQAPLPRTGGPLWPSYAGGMVLLALGMVLRRRIG